MRLYTLIAACLLPAQVLTAQTVQPVDHTQISDRVLTVFDRQFGAFRDESAALAKASQTYCAGGARAPVLDALQATWLAWAPLDPYQFGPIEQQAAALKVNLFPDKKNFTGRALLQHLKRPEAEQGDPATVAASSAALQGLPAIERLLFKDLQTCPALVGVTGNLARMAGDLYDGWFAPEGWADLVRSAGPNNPTYLRDAEFTTQVYTALGFSIQRLKEHRLGRPLGTYQRAFPKRSEAWRSGFTNAIMIAQLDGMLDVIADGFSTSVSDLSRKDALTILTDIQNRIANLGAPLFEAVEDPMMRVRIEGVMTKLDYLLAHLNEEVGRELNVETGFSAGDGD